ncbi:hypothetical protein H0H81_007059 [Sphagnurus paluster]|uniref:WW domain-containing protein n=1 Tax=Sphagnurus paluster TaxID=117069 RepID=A0A9P7FWU7_9AGAR|nr:hypothetical protein H0H81_007059 [Sphagnurus paluster]
MHSRDETKLHNGIERPVACAPSQPAVPPPVARSTTSDTLSDDISLDIRPHSTSIASNGGLDEEPDHHDIHTRTSPRIDSSTSGSLFACAERPERGPDLYWISEKKADHDMTSQLFQISNSSRVSVIPGVEILHHGGDLARVKSNQSDSNGASDFIYPLLPEETLSTYGKDSDTKAVKFKLKPYQKLSLGDLPSGWKQFTHPEGQPYFFHAEKRIVTEAWLWDEDEMKILNKFIFEIQGFVRTRRLTQPSDTHLFLEWQHWNFFPHINKPAPELFELVLNTITDARTDVQSSRETTTNYSTGELKEMAEIVEAASGSRFMLRDQYLNFYGQYGARIDRYQSIYAFEKHRRSWLIQILSFLLFAAPNVHLNAIEELWVDQLARKAPCVDFFAKLINQWGEHIVHASILLNANVSFLAIRSNDPSKNSATVLPVRTAAQIASYISVVTSFGSMMLALLLVRQHKTREFDADANVEEFQRYFLKQKSPTRGFEALAIVYSLPYALLTWA